MILCIHHVQIAIPNGSEDEARDFYCGLLGLKEVPKPDALAGRGGFWLEVGDRQVHVGTEVGVERSTGKAHVAYLVESLDEARRTLSKAGIRVIDGIPIPGYERLEFRDPFGNRVEFLAETDS
jgi:catechol 2,3-dioxygenase-like lactoylglutathione lyase family enzyme